MIKKKIIEMHYTEQSEAKSPINYFGYYGFLIHFTNYHYGFSRTKAVKKILVNNVRRVEWHSAVYY